jgi:hypothetical protein
MRAFNAPQSGSLPAAIAARASATTAAYSAPESSPAGGRAACIVIPYAFVNARQPSTVTEVLARLRALESSPSRSDGVACFARLYREVTEGVAAELGQHTFANPHFLERLDVYFANLFFAALDEYERAPAGAPHAWLPLFAQRSRKGVAPLQFALAGMNAHINRDLPVALVATCQELGMDLRDGSPEQADFERVNGLLASVEARIKRSYVTGWLSVADRLLHRFHRIDDVIAMWDVERARAAAWTNGLALWKLRDDPELTASFLLALDRMVGLAGRGLMIPADTALQKLGRFFSRL